MLLSPAFEVERVSEPFLRLTDHTWDSIVEHTGNGISFLYGAGTDMQNIEKLEHAVRHGEEDEDELRDSVQHV